MNAATYAPQMVAVAKEIRAAEVEYDKQIRAWVDAERAYKRGESMALVKVTEWKNADDRRAKAELIDGANLGDLRHAAHLAEGLKDAAKRAHQARLAELSALQSLASLTKQEARFGQTAPQEAIGA